MSNVSILTYPLGISEILVSIFMFLSLFLTGFIGNWVGGMGGVFEGMSYPYFKFCNKISFFLWGLFKSVSSLIKQLIVAPR